MKVIVISGRAQHGKDSVANFLRMELEKDRMSSVLITHYADLLKYICEKFFDWNGEKDFDGRHLLQCVGTEIIRRKSPDFWVDFIINILNFFNGRWDYVLIPDARFPNEVFKLRDAGFDVVHMRVFRPNFENGLTYEQTIHESETALNDIKPDFYIHNDGTLNDLKHKAKTWIKENI